MLADAARSHTHNSPPSSRLASSRTRPGSPNNPKMAESSSITLSFGRALHRVNTRRIDQPYLALIN